MPTKGRAPSEGTAPNRLTPIGNGLPYTETISGGAVGSNGLGRQGAHVMEMQRRRLLLAFAEVIADVGVDGASVGRVCGRAGVSRRTFYEIFEHREACFLAALDAALERISEHVAPAYARERKWSARVRAALTVALECFDSEPGLARMCVVETLRAGPDVSERRRHMIDVLSSVVDEGRGESKRGRALPPLTAQGVVGGALSVIHARLMEEDHARLVELVGPIMGMTVHPYLGAIAARKELDRRSPDTEARSVRGPNDPFKNLSIRLTYRTALVLSTIAAEGGRGSHPSNRHIAEAAGITDDGQMSRLLRRLQDAGLIENHGEGQPKGEPNAWTLTKRGEAVQEAIDG
jgi:AcrR family transcriptional regulator